MSREARALLGAHAVPPELVDAARRVAALGSGDVVRDAPLVLRLPEPHPLEARLYRPRTAPDERALVLARLSPARRDDWTATLAPRLRRVLELLRTGASEKQIADLAGLSYASAHQYVVQIYRRAGVSTRAQLMAMLAGTATLP
jgi:DNA-binding NarL/FixJ family response regulator